MSETVTTKRSGRQVEVTTTTATPSHETYESVSNNVRFYDGEQTGSFYWGVFPGGKSATNISQAEYHLLTKGTVAAKRDGLSHAPIITPKQAAARRAA